MASSQPAGRSLPCPYAAVHRVQKDVPQCHESKAAQPSVGGGMTKAAAAAYVRKQVQAFGEAVLDVIAAGPTACAKLPGYRTEASHPHRRDLGRAEDRPYNEAVSAGQWERHLPRSGIYKACGAGAVRAITDEPLSPGTVWQDQARCEHTSALAQGYNPSRTAGTGPRDWGLV